MDERILKLRAEAKRNGEPILRDKSFELLIQTVKEKQPKSILEIGVNLGLSSIAMLMAVPCAKLSGIEIDENRVEIIKNNYRDFGVQDRTHIFLGDASEILPVLTGKYDFVFLDGPKGHYYEYLPHILSCLNAGGTLFADNVLFRGYVDGRVKTPHRFNTTKHSMENFLREITTSSHLKTVIHDIEDGVSITEKLK